MQLVSPVPPANASPAVQIRYAKCSSKWFLLACINLRHCIPNKTAGQWHVAWMADKLMVVYMTIMCCFLKTVKQPVSALQFFITGSVHLQGFLFCAVSRKAGKQSLDQQHWVISCSSDWGNKKAGCSKVKRNRFDNPLLWNT